MSAILIIGIIIGLLLFIFWTLLIITLVDSIRDARRAGKEDYGE